MSSQVYDYKVWETVLHAFLNSFPYMVLALYSFRGHWRFSRKVSITILAFAVVLQMILIPLILFSEHPDNPLFDPILSAIHIIFFFAVVKDHIGKLVFSVLVLTNLGTLVVVCAKYLEYFFFPELAMQRFHYTYQIFKIFMLIIIIPIAYLFIFKDITSSGDNSSNGNTSNTDMSGYMWNYLWLVPAVFYLIWLNSYTGDDAFTNRIDLSSTLYLILIDAGSVLIYGTIINTVRLYEKNTALLAENHVLSIQQMQYDSLNERLENMRRTRHDLRHHTALLKQIRESGNLSELDDLIKMYTEKNILDQPLINCENETVNVILALYSETTYNNNISFSIKANIPKVTFVDKKDLSVLFGNILENASDACKEVEGERFINLNASYNTPADGHKSLTLIVKNNYATEPSVSSKGIFRSTKHSGDGIGISSVRNITEKYNGASTFTHQDGIFTVSVILYDNSL